MNEFVLWFSITHGFGLILLTAPHASNKEYHRYKVYNKAIYSKHQPENDTQAIII